MFTRVTTESAPALYADPRAEWWSISDSNRYWQATRQLDPATDAMVNKGFTLEIHQYSDSQYRWWLYAADSPDPDASVTHGDATTIEEAVDQVHDALQSYVEGGRDARWAIAFE